jgi:ATP-dependent helicase/nuclease subunit A
MEHLALKILKDKRFNVAEHFKVHTKEILVDEFQDTNEVQNELVELLSNGQNVFRVGDVKQSIYRFRNAQPQLMQRLMNLQDDHHQVLYLSENYRSKESIVNFNNHLFERLLNIPELNSVFSVEDKVKIGLIERQGGGEAVEIHFIQAQEKSEDTQSDEDDDDQQTLDPNLETDEDASPKALHIVQTIQDMREKSPYKNYKDYVVLVRSNAEKALLKEMFEKANIPHHIAAKTGFFNADAIQDIVLMMKALLNPHDDLNFIGLSLSPFIQLTENDCAAMALVKGNRSYYEVFNQLYPAKAKALKALFDYALGKDILTVLKAILNHNDYYEAYCDLQNKTNCDYLVEKASRYRDEDVSLSEFVRLVLRMKESDSTEAIPFTEEDDVVRVMTIHQSKGLEFRVVLYWTRLSGKIQDNQSPLLADSDLGFMIKTLELPKLGTRNNPIRLALEMKTRVDDVLEQMRLIYVALTRAVDKLIIIDNEPKTVIPLQYTAILNAMGTTYLIDSAAKAIKHKVNLEFKHHIIPPSYLKNPDRLMETQSFKPYPHQSAIIEFKTPSSTHPKSNTIRLNFNQEKGTVHGTEIHRLFEILPKEIWTQEQILNLKPDINPDDLDAFMVYAHSDIYGQMLKGKISHEYAFHALFESEVLHGYMDCVSVCENEVYLIDYKTDHLISTSLFIELYAEQILAYKKVLEKEHQKPVHAYLYSLVFKTFIEIS